MSEKKNYTENQILDLGKISPVEKGGISHSIIVALEKNLQGKDIKDIENFYKNNITSESQKAILKISMEVEKNQIPEDRKKKGNYKIVYKTDNIDLGKIKKTEEKDKVKEKSENENIQTQTTKNEIPKVESTEEIAKPVVITKTDIEDPKIDNKEISTEKNTETTPIILTPIKSDPFEMTEAEKQRRQATKEVQELIEKEKKGRNEIDIKNEILEIINSLNINFNGWKLTGAEGKSREDFVINFINFVKIKEEGIFIYNKGDIEKILKDIKEIDYGHDSNENQKNIEIAKIYDLLKALKNTSDSEKNPNVSTQIVEEAKKSLNKQ